jgi:hypothetical protein
LGTQERAGSGGTVRLSSVPDVAGSRFSINVEANGGVALTRTVNTPVDCCSPVSCTVVFGCGSQRGSLGGGVTPNGNSNGTGTRPVLYDASGVHVPLQQSPTSVLNSNSLAVPPLAQFRSTMV